AACLPPGCVYTSLALLSVASRSQVFFFQAEDGIRDATVTGVQTCALPISNGRCWDCLAQRGALRTVQERTVRAGTWRGVRESLRSEERRVGKERRYWGPTCRAYMRGCYLASGGPQA